MGPCPVPVWRTARIMQKQVLVEFPAQARATWNEVGPAPAVRLVENHTRVKKTRGALGCCVFYGGAKMCLEKSCLEHVRGRPQKKSWGKKEHALGHKAAWQLVSAFTTLTSRHLSLAQHIQRWDQR